MSKNGMNVGRGGSMEVKAPKGGEANGKSVHKQTGGDLRASNGGTQKKGAGKK